MNSKAYYAVILSLITMSIAVSIFFIPSYEQISLMLYLDKHFTESYNRYLDLYNESLGPTEELGPEHAKAREEFSNLYAKGQPTQSIVATLALLDLEFARPKAAAELLKKFVSEHSDQYALWQYLSEFYMVVMQPYNSLISLKKAFQLKPSKKNLEEQYNLYFYYNDVPNQIKALNDIVQNYNAAEDQYATLGYLLASENREQQALNVMRMMLAKEDVKDLHLYSIEFTISLMGLLDRQDDAYRLAVEYLLAHNDADVATHLAYGMLNLKMNDAGLHILDLLSPKEREKEAPQNIKLEILVSEKKYEEAFELEKKRFIAGRSSQNVFETLIQLSLQLKNYEFVENILRTHGSSLFIPETLAIEIIEKSIEIDRPSLARVLEESLGSHYLANHPFINYVLPLAFAPNVISNSDNEPVQQFSNFKSFDDWEKAILAELFFVKNYRQLAKDVLHEIDSLASLEPDRLYLTVHLFEQLGMVSQAMDLVNKERYWKKNSFILEKSWLLLSAASGNMEEVLTGIEKYHLDEGDLKDFFYATYDYHRNELALKLAQIINQRYPSLENEKYLAEAYLLNHKPIIALSIIEKLLDKNFDVFDIYLTALMEASKKYPVYRSTLRHTILKYLAKRPANKAEERNFGYVLLEYGFKQDAVALFKDLAYKQLFNNPDVQALLGIWGEHPSDKSIDWIVNRTKSYQGDEKGLWLNYLVQLKQYKTILDLVTWNELVSTKIAEAYLTAVVELKDEQLVSKVIAFLLPRTYQLKRLKELGRIARDFEQNHLAEAVYTRAYEIQPNDYETLKQLGLISSTLGKYRIAKRFFKAYYQYVPWGDYEVNSNFGQILSFKHKPKKAEQYFKLALCQLDADTKKHDIYVLITRAQLLYQLKYYDESIALYSDLLSQDPGNLSLRADFGNMLLDLGHYQYAQIVLFACYVPYKDNQIPSVAYKAELNIALAKSRYWKEKRRLRPATVAANGLIQEYPESALVYQNKANVEHDIGKWRSSIAFLKRAAALDPENENYPRALKDIWKEHRAIQIIGFENRVTTNLTTQQIEQTDRYGRVLLSGYIYPYTKWVLRGETDELFVRGFVNTEGEVSNFNGLRHREEANLIHQFMNGTTLSLAGYYSNGVVGAGIEAVPVDYYGFTTFIAEYHKPSWEFPQTEIQQGSRDRLRLGRHQRIGTRVDADVSAAIQQYNLKGVSCAVSTYAFQALVSYRIPRYYGLGIWFGEDSDLAVNYSLDSEFFMKIRTFVGPDGLPFNPIPFFNRADNRFFISYRKRFNRYLEFSGYAGYLYNPVNGGKWPGICGALLNVGSGDYYQLHLQYIHDVSVSIQNSKVDSFLMNLDIAY